MAWSTPLTATASTVLTAAQWNASVRDNLLETAPAKATTAGYHFVANGTNTIVERGILGATVDTVESTSSTTYTNLATTGPSVTLTTGTKALVWIASRNLNTTGGTPALASFEISGATTQAASDNRACYVDLAASEIVRTSAQTLMTGLTAGSNTFRMMYRAGGGTGGFAYRHIVVMGL